METDDLTPRRQSEKIEEIRKGVEELLARPVAPDVHISLGPSGTDTNRPLFPRKKLLDGIHSNLASNPRARDLPPTMRDGWMSPITIFLDDAPANQLAVEIRVANGKLVMNATLDGWQRGYVYEFTLTD